MQVHADLPPAELTGRVIGESQHTARFATIQKIDVVLFSFHFSVLKQM